VIPVDRDRLRSVQELRCAHCMAGVTHWFRVSPPVLAVYLWKFKVDSECPQGWVTGQSPMAAIQSQENTLKNQQDRSVLKKNFSVVLVQNSIFPSTSDKPKCA